MDEEVRANLRRGDTWRRIFHMLVLAFCCGVAGSVFGAVVVVQTGFVLLGGRANANLATLGAALAGYVREVWLYLSFNSERRPFPYAPWGEA